MNPSSETIYSEVSQSEVLVMSCFDVGPSLIFARKNCSHYHTLGIRIFYRIHWMSLCSTEAETRLCSVDHK